MPTILEWFDVTQWWADNHWMLQRLGCALVISMAIGLEREVRDKPAGLRTMILICLGACVFAMVSESVHQGRADATRIAAQVVSGVGFLGAGAILRGQTGIYGLTTAASIWGIAAVGVACGFGLFDLAILTGAMALLVLGLFQYVTAYIDARRSVERYRIATLNPEIRFKALDPLFDEARLKIVHRDCYQEGDEFIYVIRAMGHVSRHTRLREVLMHTSGLTLRRS